MIKKAQIKFIAIIMSILMGFFLLLSSLSAIAITNVTNLNLKRSITEFATSFSYTEQAEITDKTFVIKINDDTLEIFNIDSEHFSNEKALSVAKKALLRPNSSGRFSNVYYKFVVNEGVNYLVAMDISDALVNQRNTIGRTFLIFFVIYLLLFITVFIFSFSIFEPIREAFAKQKQFISNASHELRTPLTIISASADVLKQTDDNQWIDNVKSQTQRLESLVSDMLEIAKLDEKKPIFQIEQFNLSEEIIKSTLPFEALAFESQKLLHVDVLENLNYKGDKQSVKKVLNILLDNAIKYCSKDGVIKVCLYKKSGKTFLSVYNTGSLVPTEQSNKIFERFYRFDNSRSREFGGSGLGLSIAKSIADANKWKISAYSKPNEYMLITLQF